MGSVNAAVHVTPYSRLVHPCAPCYCPPHTTTPDQGATMGDELVCVLCKGAQDEASNITQQKLVVNNKCGHRL